MSSSTQAHHDMLEEEQYKADIARAKEYVKKMTPEQILAIGTLLNSSIKTIEKYGVGSRSFWGAVDDIKTVVASMPKEVT